MTESSPEDADHSRIVCVDSERAYSTRFRFQIRCEIDQNSLERMGHIAMAYVHREVDRDMQRGVTAALNRGLYCQNVAPDWGTKDTCPGE